MKKKQFEFLSSDTKTMIHATKWVPEGEIKGVLQICHGMVEYMGRYDDYARFMADKGFYVVGNDHLGHGGSVMRDEDHGFFGHPDGNKHVIGDIHHMRELTELDLIDICEKRIKERDGEDAAADAYKKALSIPYFMLGHSMGSFLLSQYLTIHGGGLDGAIIMGTGRQPAALLKSGKAVCRALAAVKGWRTRSRMVYMMAFGKYNDRIENARTIQDWLTRDEAIVDAFLHDPWCTYMFTLNAFHQMFEGMLAAADKKEIAKIPKDLPVLLVSGSEDPVGDYGKGVKKVYDSYVRAGIRDIKMKLYKGDRHEILNELDRETVYDDILEWISEHM